MCKAIKHRLSDYDAQVRRLQSIGIPVLLLLCRAWVGWVFFNSGLVKIASWDSTLYLFEFEYQVPLLPWLWAAYLGTAAELILPLFVVLGLLTRPMATLLFAFNIVAVVSYPLLWEKGYYDHQLWGLMLLIVMLWGAGPLSLDRLLRQQLQN
ncbi:DoxX family protein [Vibrio proteolyticus]